MSSNDHCFDDYCRRDHCPKCGRHALVLKATIKCDHCNVVKTSSELSQFHCVILPEEETVRIYRNSELIGLVTRSNKNGEPYMSFRGDATNCIIDITFSEYEIIMDNWHQMQELRQVSN